MQQYCCFWNSNAELCLRERAWKMIHSHKHLALVNFPPWLYRAGSELGQLCLPADDWHLLSLWLRWGRALMAFSGRARGCRQTRWCTGEPHNEEPASHRVCAVQTARRHVAVHGRVPFSKQPVCPWILSTDWQQSGQTPLITWTCPLASSQHGKFI